ncbi:MAG: DMT family transporter [Planctomycetota bacterium]|jgi:drug/metabolite transporter (DMT)-like permease
MDSKAKVLKYDLIFLSAAAIWGFTFVAQRVGMEHVGPFTFIAVRFLVGSVFLLPFVHIIGRRNKNKDIEAQPDKKSFLLWCTAAGTFLFLGASFQQYGLVYTTAGKAGFITGLYVIIVPMLGLLWGHKTGSGTWIGAVLAIAGLYLLSIKGRFEVDRGDMLVFFSAFFWAGHVLIIAKLSKQFDPIKVALLQYIVCCVLGFVMAIGTESIAFEGLLDALVPILYAGIMSTGIAFTLQVIGQRHAHPTHASILMSMEAIFAVVGGWLILGEIMSGRNFAGCVLMFGGMIISQIHTRMQLEVT